MPWATWPGASSSPRSRRCARRAGCRRGLAIVGTARTVRAAPVDPLTARTGPNVARHLDSDGLSDAELRVVRYLPSNLTAAEIASELVVSPNTVRTHMRHIYAKLDAHTRSQAVARARELGLVATGAVRP